jgi:hypothetical protein
MPPLPIRGGATDTEAPSLARQESDAVAVQSGACETPGHVRAGVDVDPIWSNLGVFGGRMAVHDDFAEVLSTFEERLANPQKVFRALIFQGNTGPDAGMAEKILADVSDSLSDPRNSRCARGTADPSASAACL